LGHERVWEEEVVFFRLPLVRAVGLGVWTLELQGVFFRGINLLDHDVARPQWLWIHPSIS
jgi:hypothetical protein